MKFISNFNKSVLHVAVSNKNLDVIELLLSSKKIDINSKNEIK